MGSSVLRGISTALLVTVLTLFAGILWTGMGLGGLSISRLVDIGLLASCLIGGYRSAKDSRQWLVGGITGAGFVTVGTILLALFLPVSGWGFIQVLVEGVILGLIAGAVGAGGMQSTGVGMGSGRRSPSYVPSYYSGYDVNDRSRRKADWEDDELEIDTAYETQWIESPKDELGERRKGKKEVTVQQEAVEWPWEREDEAQTKREEDFKSAEAVGWDYRRVNPQSESVTKHARPWWEE